MRQPEPKCFFNRSSGLERSVRPEWKRWGLSWFGEKIEDKEDQHSQMHRNCETVAISWQNKQADFFKLIN